MSRATPERKRIASDLTRSTAEISRLAKMGERAMERRNSLIEKGLGAGLSGAEIAKLTGLPPHRVSLLQGKAESKNE